MTKPIPFVVFCTTANSIIDYVHAARGETNEQAIQRLKPDYGTALTAMPANEAQALYENKSKTPVAEVTEKDFHYALNVLPPVGWSTASGGEVFRISERIAGCVASIYVAMQGRYFTFQDNIGLPHNTCCERVAAFIAAEKTRPSTTEERE